MRRTRPRAPVRGTLPRGLRVGAGVVAVIGVAVVVAALLCLVVVPRLLGWVPLSVLSGSMQPAIPTGSQVIVRPLTSADDVAAVEVGDVITFLPRPGDPTLVTHRVVGTAVDAHGVRTLITRGDANPSPDPDPVTAPQVRGVVAYHVPGAGYLAGVLDPGQKRAGAVGAAAALIGYAGWQSILAWRLRRRAGYDDIGDRIVNADSQHARRAASLKP